jgi:hypothetical protein
MQIVAEKLQENSHCCGTTEAVDMAGIPSPASSKCCCGSGSKSRYTKTDFVTLNHKP